MRFLSLRLLRRCITTNHTPCKHICITRIRLLPRASCSLHGLLCLPLRPQKAVKHTRPTEPAYLITLDARLALCAEKSATEPLHPKPRTSLSTTAVSSSLQRLHLPLQQARWRRDRLLVHQLRLAAASWAARRRPAATVAQLERVASSRQHEGFCTREHAGEHGSGGASGCAGQGALGARCAAALLVPRRSRFASACERANREAKQIQTRTSFLEIVPHGACQRRSAQKKQRNR